MTTATVLPELGVGFAEKTTEALDTVHIEELTPGEVKRILRVFPAVRDFLAWARESIEEALTSGVDAGEFAAKYEKVVAGLGRTTENLGRVIADVQTKLAPADATEVVSHVQAFAADVASLREFLALAAAKAKAPARPVDWQRVQEAEAAYARGETKPFQAVLLSRPHP